MGTACQCLPVEAGPTGIRCQSTLAPWLALAATVHWPLELPVAQSLAARVIKNVSMCASVQPGKLNTE